MPHPEPAQERGEARTAWRLVASPDGPTAPSIPATALAAVPEWFGAPTGQGLLLPRTPEVGRCRICGDKAQLTKEHIPPEAAGNNRRSYGRSIDDWLNRDDPQAPKGRHVQGGIWGYTLCGSCNSLTGSRYGTEYMAWASRGFKILDRLPAPATLDGQQQLGQAAVRFDGVDPGAFVRQVLSCMCTLSADWDLARWRPAVRKLVLEGQPGELPQGLVVTMRLYLGPHGRMAGPSVIADRTTGDWAWVVELAYPPFAILLTLAGTKQAVGIDISEFTRLSPGSRFRYEAVFDVGFGHTSLPSDYRSSAAIAAERRIPN